MLMAGIVLLAACKGRSAYDDTSDTVSTPKDSVKLIKTAKMQLKVKNVQQAEDSLYMLTLALDGRIVHNKLESTVIDSQRVEMNKDSVMQIIVYKSLADVAIKIPTHNIEDFMAKLGHLSIYTNNQQMDVEDKTLDYMSDKLKAQNRAEAVTTRQQHHLDAKNDTTINSTLNLKDDIVDRKVRNLKITDSANYSTLVVNLYQNHSVSKEIIANEDLSLRTPSFGSRIGLALTRGWFYFSELIVMIMHLWAFILAGGIITAAVIVIKRRQKKSLPTP